MKLQRLLSFTRKAVDDYEMIQSGDKIAVGISGGKDSLTLLYALHGLMRFYPNRFSLIAITVDLGYPDFHLDAVKQLCQELEVPYYVVKTEIARIVFEKNALENPCSLCAKLRKGALNQKALELGYNKIAYAHHRDDILETMLLSMIFEGRFYAFSSQDISGTYQAYRDPSAYVRCGSRCDRIYAQEPAAGSKKSMSG